MHNIYLNTIGSKTFSNILNDLEFTKILNSNQVNYNNKNIYVKILFIENLKIKSVRSYLLQNEPIILFSRDKDFIKKNNLNLLSFHICLELPIDILILKEMINILCTKYKFFKNSKIIIKDYEIDSNERSIKKKNVKIKLTEKELKIILMLNDNNGIDKNFLLKSIWKYGVDLETHVFETQLHRLRKKIMRYFNDNNFIVEKKSLYYLIN
jgi:DNA-binding response OmpR family regulator